MGGCCCSSRKPHLHGTPVYYYYPPIPEERESLTNNAAPALTSGFFVNLDIDTTIPDNFRPPPAPLPFDMVLGSESVHSDSARGATGGFPLGACEDHAKQDCKTQSTAVFISQKQLTKTNLNEQVPPLEEEDVCPICLEEYEVDNPSLTTKCEHHYHLSCILEWMERSDTCPICDKVMIFDHPLD